jgi:hypothetical protein
LTIIHQNALFQQWLLWLGITGARWRRAAVSSSQGEAYRSVYADLPAAVHSKQNVIYMAAELINNLPTGTAIVKALVGNRIESAVVRLPRIDDPSGTPEDHRSVRAQLLAKTPTALPAGEANKIITDRREWLKAQGAKLVALPPKPKTFRRPLKRTKGRRITPQTQRPIRKETIMIDGKIAKAKSLIEAREQIDRELSALFGLAEAPRRGRPRKESREMSEGSTTGWSRAEGHSESTTRSKSDGRGETPSPE